jgi:steroid delta-isomerase-like uncharacterized protein
MSQQDMINLARENVEAYNAGDWHRLKAALAPNVIYDEVGGQRRLQGAGQFVEAHEGWKQAGPDSKGTITNAFASGNTVMIEVHWTGTQTGPLGAIPPSGKSWSVRGAQVFTIEGGKIKELRQYFDMMTILQQMGAVPE